VPVQVPVLEFDAGAVWSLGHEPDLDFAGQLGAVSTCHCGLMSS
jgi:hypothetical protein